MHHKKKWRQMLCMTLYVAIASSKVPKFSIHRSCENVFACKPACTKTVNVSVDCYYNYTGMQDSSKSSVCKADDRSRSRICRRRSHRRPYSQFGQCVSGIKYVENCYYCWALTLPARHAKRTTAEIAYGLLDSSRTLPWKSRLAKESVSRKGETEC